MKLRDLFRKPYRTPEEKQQLRTHRKLVLVSGVLLGLAFPPVPLPVLLFFALIPWLSVVEQRKTLLDVNRSTYLMGMIFSLLTLYWVGAWTEMEDHFLMIGGFLLIFVNPILMLIPSTLYYYTRNRFGTAALYLLPVFWGFYEYFTMITDLNFPWILLGNGLPYMTLFIQLADIIGVIGLSMLLLYINIFLYKGIVSIQAGGPKLNPAMLTAAALIVIPLLYGLIRVNTFEVSGQTLRTGIVQPNLDPYNKWNAGSLDQMIDIYFDLSKETIDEGARLLLWPETALPVHLMSGRYEPQRRRITEFVKKHDVYLLTGMPDSRYYQTPEEAPSDARYSEASGYYFVSYNGVLLFSPDIPRVQRYGKQKLVPFGERAPFVNSVPFLKDFLTWGVGIGGWNVGEDTTLFRVRPKGEDHYVEINGSICFESVFPYLAAEFCSAGADFIAVVTNDSWYGHTSGPYQHKEIAVLRAVENRKAVARAANGGISTLIDPLGRTIVSTSYNVRTTLTVDIPIQSGTTFFSRNAMLIPWLVSVVTAFTVLLLIVTAVTGKICKRKTEA